MHLNAYINARNPATKASFHFIENMSCHQIDLIYNVFSLVTQHFQLFYEHHYTRTTPRLSLSFPFKTPYPHSIQTLSLKLPRREELLAQELSPAGLPHS